MEYGCPYFQIEREREKGTRRLKTPCPILEELMDKRDLANFSKLVDERCSKDYTACMNNITKMMKDGYVSNVIAKINENKPGIGLHKKVERSPFSCWADLDGEVYCQEFEREFGHILNKSEKNK
jgi:hypothetical protein